MFENFNDFLHLESIKYIIHQIRHVIIQKQAIFAFMISRIAKKFGNVTISTDIAFWCLFHVGLFIICLLLKGKHTPLFWKIWQQFLVWQDFNRITWLYQVFAYLQ